MSGYGVALFQNAHDAIMAERAIRPILQVTLMPVPRQFSTECGIALRFSPEHRSRIEALLAMNQIVGRIEIVADNREER